MRKLLKYTLLSASFLSLLSSCSDSGETSKGETPSIKYIRFTDIDLSDQLLTSAPMGTCIAIVGENLGNVVKAIFNDLDAKLNPTLVTSNTIIVDVPSIMPSKVTHKLTLVTASNDSLTHDFMVEIPSPSVSSISCEWARVGDKATLYGSSFFEKSDGDIDVIFPGNIDAEVLSFTDTSIDFIVPEGAAKGNITVSNDYGKGRSSFNFMDETGIFIDGENPSKWNGWNLSDFDNIDGLAGEYIKLKGATGQWAWPANSIQLFYVNPTATPLVSEGEVNDYALKFECYSHVWQGTPMLVWFDDGNPAHNVDGPYAQYHWRPYMTAPGQNYTTDGWVTVTMPLSEFIYSKDETENNRKIGSLSELMNLNIMFFGNAETNNSDFPLELWIDNIRLVNIK